MISLMTALLLMSEWNPGPKFEVVRAFQAIPESETALTTPYTASFAPDGSLYLVDSKMASVYVWNPDGSFRKSFGTQGQGPGEMRLPAKIVVTDKHVWIWGYFQNLYQFTLDGAYVKTLYPQFNARVFAILNDNLILSGRRREVAPKDIRMTFELLDGTGKTLKIVKDWPNTSYLSPRKETNAVTVKAFGPELDIQKGEGNTWYIGYSEESVLYQINDKGEIIGSKTFVIPTEKPTAEDRKFYENLGLTTVTGAFVEVKSLKNLSHDFDYEKAFYTQMLIKNDKAVFALTPLGSKNGCGNGFNTGTFFVNDFQTGKTLENGRYDFPNNSVLFFRDGHLIAVINNSEGAFEVYELKIRGV